jgi:hypothetical protein
VNFILTHKNVILGWWHVFGCPRDKRSSIFKFCSMDEPLVSEAFLKNDLGMSTHFMNM